MRISAVELAVSHQVQDMSEYKPVLENFKGREDLVFVIDRFNYIEYKVTEIISSYIGAIPERKKFVNSILLNNSIVSFGAKIKLLFHINSIEKLFDLKKDDFHRLAHIRNQFAHSGQEVFEICLEEPELGGKKLMLESVASSGRLIEVDASKALSEFTQIFARLKQSLNLAAEKANKLSQQDAANGASA